jgi:hypothetical protein
MRLVVTGGNAEMKMQVKLGPNYRVQVSKRVHVSRMISTPFAAARAIWDEGLTVSVPVDGAHSNFLLHTRNSRRIGSLRSLFSLWRELLSPASAPSLLDTI